MTRSPNFPRGEVDGGGKIHRNRIAGVSLSLAVWVVMVSALHCTHGGGDFNFGVVAPAVLMRSGQPRPEDLERIVEEHGLKTIMNLRTSVRIAKDADCQAEKVFAETHGIAFVNLPVSTPPTREQIGRFLSIMDDPATHPVLIHCAAGQIRAGMMCAVYGIERLGWSNERALAEQIPYKFEHSRAHKEAARLFILGYRPETTPQAKVLVEP